MHTLSLLVDPINPKQPNLHLNAKRRFGLAAIGSANVLGFAEIL
jgi:hypothetical protein